MVSLSWNFERCLETFPFSVNNSSWYISLLALLKCMKNELTLFTISICVSSCDDVSCIVIDKIYQINTDCRSVSKNVHAVYLNCYLLEGYWSDKCCFLWIGAFMFCPFYADRLLSVFAAQNFSQEFVLCFFSVAALCQWL